METVTKWTKLRNLDALIIHAGVLPLLSAPLAQDLWSALYQTHVTELRILGISTLPRDLIREMRCPSSLQLIPLCTALERYVRQEPQHQTLKILVLPETDLNTYPIELWHSSGMV